LIIEFERSGESQAGTIDIASALQRIVAAPALPNLCDEVATIFAEITGYDRVMVYRFDEEGHGEVFSERRRPDRDFLRSPAAISICPCAACAACRQFIRSICRTWE
jgi:light-regulated signal transduction histidine kinase (bacteriophytochrome)